MDKEQRTILQAFMLITQLGVNVLVTMGLCVWFGNWLDKQFGTGFLVIVFLILGMLASYRNGYMMTRRFVKKNKTREELEQEYIDSLKREREGHDRERK